MTRRRIQDKHSSLETAQQRYLARRNEERLRLGQCTRCPNRDVREATKDSTFCDRCLKYYTDRYAKEMMKP